MSTHLYYAYGLHFRSTIPLPEFLPAESGNVDVEVQIGKIDFPADGLFAEKTFSQLGEQECFLSYPGVGRFSITNGNEILVEPFPETEERLVRIIVTGVALGILLQQRGCLVLHSSAVSINGQAVAFIGEKGWGKSTMAATLHARGHDLVADDIVAIDYSSGYTLGEIPTVLPGFPLLKLWPDAVTSIGEDPEELDVIYDGFPKRTRKSEDNFSNHPVPLARIYLLSGGTSPEIEPLAPHEALPQIIGHSYLAGFGNTGIQNTGQSLHLRQCVNLIQSVPVLRLKRHSSLEALPQIACLIEDNLSKSNA